MNTRYQTKAEFLVFIVMDKNSMSQGGYNREADYHLSISQVWGDRDRDRPIISYVDL